MAKHKIVTADVNHYEVIQAKDMKPGMVVEFHRSSGRHSYTVVAESWCEPLNKMYNMIAFVPGNKNNTRTHDGIIYEMPKSDEEEMRYFPNAKVGAAFPNLHALR